MHSAKGRHSVTRCLVISNGPFPTPEHGYVEGGGLRCWGLARGIKQNLPDVELTLAYNDSYRMAGHFTDESDGLRITTWRLESLEELLSQADLVVVSYCMGELSLKVAQLLKPQQQLILDCYVPIYVEVSARNTNDLDREYRNYLGDVARWSEVLRRGDIFLCASQEQQRYYQGVLSAVGRINPATYGAELQVIVPFGIDRELPVASDRPISRIVGDSSARRVLWFGGVYPWFDINNLVEAVRTLDTEIRSRLVVVGARNPFNSHPDFVRSSAAAERHVNRENADDIVYFQDWVPFGERANWYLDSDVVVLINRMGEENKLAWRTRLADYIWADRPILTNGGDPLGELLIGNSAALRVDESDPTSIAGALRQVFTAPDIGGALRAQLRRIRETLYWDVVTRELAAHVQAHTRAPDLSRFGMSSVVQPRRKTPRQLLTTAGERVDAFRAYSEQFGVASALQLTRRVIADDLGYLRPRPSAPGRLVILSHQLDLSGGPMVAIDLASDVRARLPGVPVEFYTYLPADKENVRKLNAAGIKPRILPTQWILPEIRNNDVVLMNTAAQYPNVKHELLGRAESGRIRKLLWYVHEDDPPRWFKDDERERMQRLLDSSRLRIFIAGRAAWSRYREFFDDSRNVELLPLRVTIPTDLTGPRHASAFHERLSFVMSGTLTDGRKGQLPILYAFGAFFQQFFKHRPTDYREFDLTFIGVEQDLISQQVKAHHALMEGRVVIHPLQKRRAALELVARANMTICYSITECLPIFVYEGMLTGHPLLRNDCSGADEQLEPERNGYALVSDDFWQVVDTIERVLSREKTSDQRLGEMSQRSFELAAGQQNADYSTTLVPDLAQLSRRSAHVRSA